jgi:AAA+ ATPase superfamily predicted ATPase
MDGMATSSLLDRSDELSRLEAAWSLATQGRPQLAVLWGRRRVGKTFLAAHFAAGKRSVFFPATQQAELVELARLLETASRQLGPAAIDLAGGGFASWEAALRFFSALSVQEPLLLVIDEVPYLARSTPGFASIVQSVWDHLPTGRRLMIVLTGSAVGTIESVLGAGGALRGRATLAFRLDPVDFTQARLFLPHLAPARLIEAYAACGGYPLHLLEWDQDMPTVHNLERLAGSPGGILLEDALGMLREELPDTGGYSRILAAIGRGRTRASEIATEVDQRIEHPIEVLTRAGFVHRSVPVGAPKRARPIYVIDDPYLAFWFAVLYSDLSLVEAGQGAAVLERRKPEWDRHLGAVFEDQARRHAVRLVQAGRLPKDLLVGRWWATSGEPCEVDVLGMRGSHTVLVGEAKWQSRKLGLRELRSLISKSRRVPQLVADPVYALWGRNGVETSATAAGARGFNLTDMLSV